MILNGRAMRWLRVLVFVPLLLALSGCLKYTAEFTIIDTEKMDIKMDYSVEKKALEEAGTPVDDWNCDAARTFRSKATPYEENGYVGCRIEGKITLSEMQATGMSVTKENGQFTFRWKPTPEVSQNGTFSSDIFTEFQVSVTFPGEVVSHSGDSTVSGTTVTWTKPSDLYTETGLEAVGKEGGLPLTLLIVGGVVAGIIVLGVILALALGRRKKTGTSHPGALAGQYPQQQGQYPGQPPRHPGQYSGQPPQYPGQGQPPQYPGHYSGQPPQYPGQGPPAPGQHPHGSPWGRPPGQ